MKWNFVTPEIKLNTNYLFRFKKITGEYDYDYGCATRGTMKTHNHTHLILKMKGEEKIGWGYQINPKQIEYSVIPE